MKGAPRAYIHRAHSGPFGMVNSEEGYQNLSRFLFGNVRYEIELAQLTIKKDLPGLKEKDILDYLEINVDISIRGLPTYIHTRRELDESSIVVPVKASQLNAKEYHQVDPHPTHLFTGFLRTDKKMEGDGFLRGAIQLRIIPHYRHEGWVRDSRFEGESMLNDRLHFGVRPSLKPLEIEYRWGMGFYQHQKKKLKKDRSVLFSLPNCSQRYLNTAGIRVKVSPWH